MIVNAGRLATLLSFILVSACTKVPITDIEARFDRADSAWFEDEQTLFFFYELSAEQGLSENSLLEVTYRTDDAVVDWTSIDNLAHVHTHVGVDCGFTRRCGSLSLHVPIEPRDISIRLRYHVDGALALTSTTAYNVIGSGPAHTNRSFLVYGVFTEDNRRIQWRGRHRFPTLRNEEVQELGLRRSFRIDTQQYGTAPLAGDSNPYGYATGCPDGFVTTPLEVVSTVDRAVFNVSDLPLAASGEAVVCARATVHEPARPFVTTALAQKNPEVEAAFPLLRSPINEATPITFYLAPCNRTISAEHDAMQRQRILYGDGPPTCIDDSASSGFVDRLVALFRDAIERTRPAGNDMVLVVGLHRDDAAVADRLEEALAQVLPAERDRSTPRVVGGFVFDSDIRDVRDEQLGQLILWCPARVIDEDIERNPDPSQVSCAIVPDNPSLNLGPFTLSGLPILPSRSRYLDFIDQFSEAQAGEVKTLSFLAPEFTPTTDNTDLGNAVATFFNQEIISAAPTDAFSFCETEMFNSFVFRSETTRSDELNCPDEGPMDGEFCLPEPQDFVQIEFLPQWHDYFQETTYELGLVWDFPWLLRATYEVVAAVSAGAFGLSLPFGFAADQTDSLGTEIWATGEFPLAELLTHCKRFCDHPTFDSAGVYNVTASFRETYGSACYRPLFPMLGDSSFPRDP